MKRYSPAIRAFPEYEVLYSAVVSSPLMVMESLSLLGDHNGN
jgi:hypothetical protein